jgi:hypothetical protein
MGVRDSGGSDLIFSSEELGNYYSSVGEDGAGGTYSDGLFYFSNVTDKEVSDAIRGIKSEALGLNGISIRFLRLILPSILTSSPAQFFQMLGRCPRFCYPRFCRRCLRLWRLSCVTSVH